MRAVAVVVALGLSVPTAALAGNDSVIALGIGTHTTIARATLLDGTGSQVTGRGQGATLRLRLFYLLGAELSYDVSTLKDVDNLNVPPPTYQWSGLLYLASTTHFSLFFLGGFGATSTSDLFAARGVTTSYHGGAGIEVGFTANWIVAADFRLNVPAVGAAGRDNGQSGGSATLTERYNLGTWQTNLGVRFYL